MKRLIFAIIILSASVITAWPQSSGKVFWKGMVDAKIRLTIKGDKITTETLDGRPYPDGVYSFTTPLPNSDSKVVANKTDGRGTVAVTQQPAEDNDFTAVVEITDPKGGAKEYKLEILWN